MVNYDSFAEIYDQFCKKLPYDKLIKFIVKILKKNKLRPSIILDLACGTGNLSIPLAKMGYKVIGVDSSQNMLTILRKKAYKEKVKINLAHKSIIKFKLKEKIKLILCFGGSLNELSGMKELKTIFEKVYEALENKGIFIFDLVSLSSVKNSSLFQKYWIEVNANNYLLEYQERKNDSVIITSLIFRRIRGDLFNLLREKFKVKAYALSQAKRSLIKIGFSRVDIYKNISLTGNKKTSLIFVCRK